MVSLQCHYHHLQAYERYLLLFRPKVKQADELVLPPAQFPAERAARCDDDLSVAAWCVGSIIPQSQTAVPTHTVSRNHYERDVVPCVTVSFWKAPAKDAP